nr:hypothetical protein [Parabacteroides goldsteinii]
MNSAFLRFRLRQFEKFIREIPVIYLIILTGILLIAGIALFELSKEPKGALIITAVLLALLSLLQLRRKDYHFILHAEEKAWKVFGMDYLLLSLPVIFILLLHFYWYIAFIIPIGCIGISFIKQPFHRTKQGISVPGWLPAEAFEIRSGIRQYGGLLLVLYISAWIGLLLPFASLASLWFLTVFISEMFRYSESQQILFTMEKPARRFLHRKLLLNLRLPLYAIVPVCVVYISLYPAHWWLILTFLIGITLNILLFVTTKYAYYWPDSRITAGQIPIAIAIFSIFMPILTPVILFFLIRNYLAACRNLNTYLYAYNPEPGS